MDLNLDLVALLVFGYADARAPNRIAISNDVGVDGVADAARHINGSIVGVDMQHWTGADLVGLIPLIRVGGEAERAEAEEED